MAVGECLVFDVSTPFSLHARLSNCKDVEIRVPSSEEEDRDTFATLSKGDESPNTTPNVSPPDSHTSSPFRDLLATSDPIQSDRSSWCLRRDASLSDNWQRTAHHYRREDDEKTPQTPNWYRSDARAQDVYPGSKISWEIGDSGTGGSSKFDEYFTRIPRGQSAVKLLSKHVSGLKKRIKRFEEEFERKMGYKPTHQDKMKHEDIKKQMSLLSRMKKELKQLKEDLPDKKRNAIKAYPMSLLRCQESTASPPTRPTSEQPTNAQETLRHVEERLTFKRDDANRPIELTLLSLEQFQDEKIDLQKALLYYESKHGRPVTREDRDRVRPLYDRYRQVKRGIVRLSSRTKESLELAPILEHVAMDFTLASPQHRGSLQDDLSEAEVIVSGELVNPDPHPEIRPSIVENSSFSPLDVNLGGLHSLPIHELKERKKEAKEQKRKLRTSLKEYEAQFENENGRKMQKEDRGPMEQSYGEYKHVKAKLRLLEALLSKHVNISMLDS